MRKLGIVGIRGALSRAQMTAHYGGVEIAAACDLRKDRRQMAANIGIPVYDDYDQMLAKSGIDSIIIGTPNYLHCEMTLKAFEKGLDVFVEKPMANTLEDCDKMIEASKAANKILMVGLCYRYSNLYREFVDQIHKKTVGLPKQIWCKEFRGFWGHKGDEWRLSQELSGGAIVEKNCHHFDIINWAAQSPALKVQAFGGNAIHNNSETIDHAMVNVEYANGIKATLMLSLFIESFDQLEIGAICDSGKIETLQLHGQIQKDGLIEEVSKVGCLAESLSVWPLPGTETKRTVTPYYCPLWPDGQYQHLGSGEQFKVFNACLTKGIQPPVSGEIGRESLIIPLAAEESIKCGGKMIEIKQ